ncbi:hypothetical protein HK099_005008, partial [Clydaea vesicula]
MLLGYMISGTIYSIGQIISIVFVTVGVLVTTIASAESSVAVNAGDSEENFNFNKDWILGIGSLCSSVLISCFLGLYQQNTYAKYGSHWREGLQLNENKLINEEKRLEKTNKKLQNLYLKLDNIDKKKDSINNDVRRSKILKEIESLNADKHDINARILNLKMTEFLIKSGKLTPFSLLDEKFNHDISVKSDSEEEVKLTKNSISYELDSDFQLDIEGKLSDDDDNFVENDELEKTQSEENLIKDIRSLRILLLLMMEMKE